jgi:hypothetical protein
VRSRFVSCACSVAALLLALLLGSCASPPRAEPLTVPGAIELRDEPQISTFHFPRGVYSLADQDASGFYYAAPRHVIKHGFPGSIPYDGGIFMQRDDHRKIRAYVIWAGGRTKIGNLAGANLQLLD